MVKEKCTKIKTYMYIWIAGTKQVKFWDISWAIKPSMAIWGAGHHLSSYAYLLKRSKPIHKVQFWAVCIVKPSNQHVNHISRLQIKKRQSSHQNSGFYQVQDCSKAVKKGSFCRYLGLDFIWSCFAFFLSLFLLYLQKLPKKKRKVDSLSTAKILTYRTPQWICQVAPCEVSCSMRGKLISYK